MRSKLGPNMNAASLGYAREPAAACSSSSAAQSRTKRAFDVVAALVLVLALAPLLLLVALAIVMDSPGPILFRQQRTGLNGVPFWIAKFRTMTVMENGAEVLQASRADPRITSVGRFLRRSSLDELPQLLNVLSGDMSLVGPRPHALAHDRKFAELAPAYDRRFRARPGITGLAQARGFRGEIHTLQQLEQRVEHDNTYIDDWSLRLDMMLLVQTAVAFAFHKNAY